MWIVELGVMRHTGKSGVFLYCSEGSTGPVDLNELSMLQADWGFSFTTIQDEIVACVPRIPTAYQ